MYFIYTYGLFVQNKYTVCVCVCACACVRACVRACVHACAGDSDAKNVITVWPSHSNDLVLTQPDHFRTKQQMTACISRTGTCKITCLLLVPLKCDLCTTPQDVGHLLWLCHFKGTGLFADWLWTIHTLMTLWWQLHWSLLLLSTPQRCDTDTVGEVFTNTSGWFDQDHWG